MKTYLFITASIYAVGGMQMYVSGKAEYLEKCGWTVKVAFSDFEDKPCPVVFLNKYRDGCIYGVNVPPFRFPAFIRAKIISNLKKLIGTDNEEIIIESHDDRSSMWGEMLASRVSAKHIIVLLNEIFRGQDRFYEDKIDFYSFKHDRKEIAGTNNLKMLFKGYREIPDSETQPFFIDEDPVRDISSEIIDRLPQLDYNICYLGRIDKTYLPSVVGAVSEFALKFRDHSIQFIIVGDYSILDDSLKNKMQSIPNLKVSALGTLIPIPKKLFSHMDVLIATGGSARCGAYEGVPVVVPDPVNMLSIGILGYDSKNSGSHIPDIPQNTIEQDIERVLIQRVQSHMTYDYPAKRGIAVSVKQNFEVIQSSIQTKAYYDTKLLIKGKRIRSVREIGKYTLALYSPGLFKKLKRR